MDLNLVAAAASDFARDYLTKGAPKRIKVTDNDQHKAVAATAIIAAAADVVNAIARAIVSQVAVLAHNTKSVSSIIDLAMAAVITATEASRTVADAFDAMEQPSGYEESVELSNPPATGEDRRVSLFQEAYNMMGIHAGLQASR